jgi:prephenate dehydrogenase
MTRPIVGIVGSRGAYGRWLARFFRERMGLQVVGRDPAGDTALSERALIEASDVLVFAAPIRHTAELIARYVEVAAGDEAGRLWLDVTSIKRAPVAALLASRAEVVGLHPMCAPPQAPTLRGRVMVVCEARVECWRDWMEHMLAALEAECVRADPDQHDQRMALVQAMVHAVHLAQAAVLGASAEAIGGPADILPFRSVSFELDATVAGRILAGNPAIYEDIQFSNPDVLPMLDPSARRVGRAARLRGRRRRRQGALPQRLPRRRPGLVRRRRTWPRPTAASSGWATCWPISPIAASSTST